MSEEFLMHYGVKGMRWGVISKRRKRHKLYKNIKKSSSNISRDFYAKGMEYPNRGVIPKGSAIYRVTWKQPKYDLRGGSLRYVSHTPKDQLAWYEHMSSLFRYQTMHANTYETVVDIKIADLRALNDAASKFIPDQKAAAKAVKDMSIKDFMSTEDINKYLTYDGKTYDPGRIASRGMMIKTPLGKEVVNELKSQGYGGVVDPIGTDVAKDPIVLFDPSKKLKLVKTL